MQFAPGTRIGQYEIAGTLGAGGMGVVYRARDTRLGRDVAFKILPESFASDPDRVMRFEREARTLASLNHPHIAIIHGLEEALSAGRPVRALVMELVEGEDLDARLSRGPVPLAEALPMARQIALALESAHEAGVIHRDLKPANIKVKDDGTVKVLDFGLAKAMGSPSPGSTDPGRQHVEPDLSPTMTSPAMTALGMILGTAAYMSPEQAKGKSVDRRADVWAFGVVVYELLTGKGLFGRDDVSETLAAVLTHEPDLAKLPAATPAPIRRMLARCLAKDPRQRLDSMMSARLEIDEADAMMRAPAAVTPAPTPAAASWIPRAAAIAAAMFALGWVTSLAWPGRNAAAHSSRLVAQIAAPPDLISAFHDGFAISPDGETLAFVGRDASGQRQIWIRRFDGNTAQPVRGTNGATYPMWSPDGNHLAFFVDYKIWRVPVSGGPPQSICDARGTFPVGSWGGNDELLFSVNRGAATRVLRVAASGGTPVALEHLGVAARPTWLADGRHLLYVAMSPDSFTLRFGSADGGETRLIESLPPDDWGYGYVPTPTGQLLLNRNNALTTQEIDASTGNLTGTPTPIGGIAGTPKGWFAVSARAGRLVGLLKQSPSEMGDPGDPVSRLQWVNQRGESLGTLGDPGRYWTLNLDPDGRRATANPGGDLWLFDPSNRHVRLTSAAESFNGVWSPDGSEVVFFRGGQAYRQRVDLEHPAAPLDGAMALPTDWSADGNSLLLAQRPTASTPSMDILIYDLKAKRVTPWLATEFDEGAARMSTDGKWIAYASTASGRPEVYIKSSSGVGKAIQVSTTGGIFPLWRRDGRELYYLGLADEVMAAGITVASGTLNVGEPRRLFRIPLNDITMVGVGGYLPYAVTPDGGRFLLNVPDRVTPLVFMQR